MDIKQEETMNDYAAELEASFRQIKEGDIITGTVIDVQEEEVTLDLKYYAQGIIKAADMSESPEFSILRDVAKGDTIEATVLKMDDGNGNIQLSKKAASQTLAWDKLKQYMADKTVLTVKISGVTNAGVISYLEDVRGFIPASQLSLEYVEDLNTWLNKIVRVQVITVDPAKKKLVMSAKNILREEEKEAHNHKIAMMVPGTEVEGVVESIMPYGAFVNLGDGLSGLVHVSQISQKRIKTPADVLSVGQKITAKILNTKDGKIALSMKALEESPKEYTPRPDKKGGRKDDFHYKSEGDVTTNLGSLFKNLKL
jgi:small subunit ribosomal protein S1